MKRSTYLLIFLFFTALSLSAQDPKGIKPTSTSAATGGNTWALIVGISEYTFINKLNYAHRDAEAFNQFLLSPAGGSIPQANIKLLVDEKATTAQIVKALDNLVAQVKPGDRVILYFAGHGDQETLTIAQFGFLLTHDTSNTNYMAGGLMVMAFQTYIATLSTKNKANVTVFLDACHAGRLAGNEYGGVQLTGEQLAKQVANEAKLMACQTGEISLEGKQWDNGHGAFTYHLIRGLQGLADTKPTGNEDGQVTLREVERYLEDHVSPDALPVKQTPFKVGDAGTVLATVHIPTLTALKTNQPLPAFAPVAGRGFVDDVLTKADSQAVKSYQLFQKYLPLKNGEQLMPVYKQLLLEPSLTKAIPFISRDLAAALIDEGQTILGWILDTQDPDTFNTVAWSMLAKIPTGSISSGSSASSVVSSIFDRFSNQMAYAAKILGPESAFYKPTLAKSAFYAGMKAEVAKDSATTLRAFQEAIRLDSAAAFVYCAQGGYLAELKRWADAEVAFRAGLRFAPKWAFLHNNLGDLQYKLKRYNEAEQSYRKAVESKPDYADACNNLGNLLYELKRYDEAIPQVKHYTKLKPSDANGWNLLGICSLYIKDYSTAKDCFEREAQLVPAEPTAPYNLACLYSLENKPAEALIWLEKAFEKGYTDFAHIAEDTDLDNIRQSKRFKAMLKKYQSAKP